MLLPWLAFNGKSPIEIKSAVNTISDRVHVNAAPGSRWLQSSQWWSISNAKSTVTPKADTPLVWFSTAHPSKYEILIILCINILKGFLNILGLEDLFAFWASSPVTLFDLKGDGGWINTIIDNYWRVSVPGSKNPINLFHRQGCICFGKKHPHC